MDLTKTYICPDCNSMCTGKDLIYKTSSDTILYVCPECGCVQETKEVEQQLRKEN